MLPVDDNGFSPFNDQISYNLISSNLSGSIMDSTIWQYMVAILYKKDNKK